MPGRSPPHYYGPLKKLVGKTYKDQEEYKRKHRDYLDESDFVDDWKEKQKAKRRKERDISEKDNFIFGI
jgi:hypothetical protein